MQTKLTLRIDNNLIARAKQWARANRTSLSQAIAEFLARLPAGKGAAGLTPWTRRLLGAASRKGRPARDEEVRRSYRDFVAKKHR